MKWLLIAAPVLAALVAAVLAIVVIGMLLPRTHKATRSIRLAVAPEQLWALIADYPARPQWVPGLKGVERLADRHGHPVWKDIRADGWGMPYEIETADAPRRLVTRIADDTLPFGGTWTWEITSEPADSRAAGLPAAGVRLRLTEEGEIKSAPFRYFAALGDMTSTMQEVMKALAQKLNQPAVIEP